MKRALWILLVAAAGCLEPEGGTLPRILAAGPSGDGLRPDAVRGFVELSEPPDLATVDGHVALVKLDDAKKALSQAATAGGIAPDLALPARLAVTQGGTVLTLAPSVELAPRCAFALVFGKSVRSARGQPYADAQGAVRGFSWVFTTGAALDHAPVSARWVVPPPGAIAPSNVARVELAFSAPVLGKLLLDDARGRPSTLGADRLAFAPAGVLPPGEARADLSEVSAHGRRIEEAPGFEVSACEDRLPPFLDDGAFAAEASDDAATLSFAVSEPASLEVEVATREGEAACGAVPAWPATRTVEVPPSACDGYDPCGEPAECAAAIALDRLCPARTLRVRARAVDLAGNASSAGAWHELTTAPPRPRPILDEVLANAVTPEAGGEYVEIANAGTGEADLAGFTLAKRTSTGEVTCALERLGGPIPAGGYGLVVGGSYDGRYGLPAGAPVFRCGDHALLGGLANDRPAALVLADPGGDAVSTIGIDEVAPHCEAAHALERIHPRGPDAATNYGCADGPPPAGSPLRCNTLTPPEECVDR